MSSNQTWTYKRSVVVQTHPYKIDTSAWIISVNGKVIVWLELELAYCNMSVKHVSHYGREINVCACIHTYVCVCVCACMCMYVCMYIYIYIYIYAGHCWRSKDELITDVLLWTPAYGQAKAGDQLEHTYSSYVRIRDVALTTFQKRWIIGRSGKRGSGISVLAARHDDDKYYLVQLNRSWK